MHKEFYYLIKAKQKNKEDYEYSKSNLKYNVIIRLTCLFLFVLFIVLAVVKL